MTQQEANNQFRAVIQRIHNAKQDFREGIKEYEERYSVVNGEVQDDYMGDVTENEADDLSGYVSDYIDELQGIHDDITQIFDEGIDDDEEDNELSLTNEDLQDDNPIDEDENA